ncbi:hypothetical protein IF1G_01729 [Cordyceps javanica]|uniref:Uncharacterized protein n=1 Tax=Cordyceps javanica TaxID=43265 RepID=A0A545VCR3_9HYPO|nr:hypothetical protein IF1G_01729 [Cordyceps javanica]
MCLVRGDGGANFAPPRACSQADRHYPVLCPRGGVKLAAPQRRLNSLVESDWCQRQLYFWCDVLTHVAERCFIVTHEFQVYQRRSLMNTAAPWDCTQKEKQYIEETRLICTGTFTGALEWRKAEYCWLVLSRDHICTFSGVTPRRMEASSHGYPQSGLKKKRVKSARC